MITACDGLFFRGGRLFRMEKELNRDTISLLQECSSGCKMAMDSIRQIKDKVNDKQIREIMDKYFSGHSQLEAECRQILNDVGAQDKEPGVIATTMANIQTNIKMMMEDDAKKAAEILTDGCNMGIKSLSSYINEFKNADSKSVAIAEKLRRLEDNMIGDLQPML